MFTGPVQQTATSTGGAFQTGGFSTGQPNNLLTGGPKGTTTGKPTFSYAGSGRGNYIQESKYIYVGPTEGEFERVASPRTKKSNYALVCGFITAASFVGVLVYAVQPTHAKATTAAVPAVPGARKIPAGEFNCQMEALIAGERVQAGADISFRPAGAVPEGTYGIVAEDADADEKGVVIVDFDGYPQLAKAHVTRNLIIKAVDLGDRVEAVTDVGYTPIGEIHDAPFAVADLVRATTDLGVIQRGTYGTLVSMGPDNSYVVKFAGSAQLSTVKVSKSHIIKAAQVGDHVQAVADINCGGESTVPQGAFGSVITMEPVEKTFHYVVDFRHLASNCQGVVGSAVKVIAGPVGRATVPQGTVGTVSRLLQVDGNAQYDYVVAWDGLAGTGARAARGEIIKVEEWSQARTQWCCDNRGVACTSPKPAAMPVLSTSRAAPPQTTTEPDMYNCFAEGRWEQDQAKWCCAVKGFGCAFTSTRAPTVALYRCVGDTELEIQAWSDKKARWCCDTMSLGCRSGHRL
mmetsp:Transcript_22875/g.60436  ORF Transcript_22875/g.60436 Transcript_22875/m.60436 type:complete len:517 (-) Transcript_22875:243-1793(-)